MPITPEIEVIHFINQPEAGGAEFIVRELNLRLSAHGIASSVVYLSNARGKTLRDAEWCLDLDSSRSLNAIRRVRAFVDGNVTESTILHGHLTDALYLLAMPGVGRKARKVYTEHNTHNRRRAIPMLRPLERRIYNQYDRIVCVSPSVREALLDWIGDTRFGGRTTVVNNGARHFRCTQREPWKDRGLRLLSVASLTPKKGIAVAIDAVGHARDCVERYVIVGEGEQRKALERRAVLLGVQDKVRFVGWSDAIEEWMHASDVMLIPSRWEGFGLSAVEALSTGMPVIGSDVPGLRDVLGETGASRLVPVGDSEAMAMAIREIAAWGECPASLATAARERAGEYQMDAMVRGYADVYRRI